MNARKHIRIDLMISISIAYRLYGKHFYASLIKNSDIFHSYFTFIRLASRIISAIYVTGLIVEH